jgi:hypothetical protein
MKEYSFYILTLVKDFMAEFLTHPNFWAVVVSIAMLMMASATYRLAKRVSDYLRFQMQQKTEGEKKLKRICLAHLKNLQETLVSVYPESKPQKGATISLNRNAFNEVHEGIFIYYDVLLKHLEHMNPNSFTKTIEFFHKYQVVLGTIGTCMGELTMLGQEKSDAYYELTAKIREAIKELS